ncbi:unnamed protein product, partial [Discosporangium mesarthrocarpum]
VGLRVDAVQPDSREDLAEGLQVGLGSSPGVVELKLSGLKGAATEATGISLTQGDRECGTSSSCSLESNDWKGEAPNGNVAADAPAQSPGVWGAQESEGSAVRLSNKEAAAAAAAAAAGESPAMGEGGGLGGLQPSHPQT